MPTFRTAPSSNLSASIKRLLASGGGQLSPLQELQVDQQAAETAQKTSLAEKARLEVEDMRKATAARADPAARTEFATHSAGINVDEGNRLMAHIRGALEQPSQADIDDADRVGSTATPFPTAAPVIEPGQDRRFRSALAATMANELATGKTNAEQLTQAAGNIQTQGVSEAVRAAIERGDYHGASALNQGAKPGEAIKLHENIGSTGATFAPATGKVAADPTADLSNRLLPATIASEAAQAEQRRAAAEASRAQAEKARSEAKEGAKPPPNYRWGPPDASGAPTLVAITGGPADTKAGVEAKKTESRLAIARGKADVVIGSVDKALDQTGFFTSGLIGENLGKIPGTPAYDLRKTVTTIKANIGFQELQAMREASPTGGALGQVAVQELEALQAVLASLDAGQSTPQLTENLKKVKKHYENWKRTVAQDKGNEVPQGPVEARKTVGNVEFVKIGGKWFTP